MTIKIKPCSIESNAIFKTVVNANREIGIKAIFMRSTFSISPSPHHTDSYNKSATKGEGGGVAVCTIKRVGGIRTHYKIMIIQSKKRKISGQYLFRNKFQDQQKLYPPPSPRTGRVSVHLNSSLHSVQSRE